MMVGEQGQTGGCYRSPDSIKNLRIRVRYRRIEDVFALDTEEDEFEEVTLAWQEKLFSRAEFERYRKQTDNTPRGSSAATQQTQADRHYRDVVRHMAAPMDTTISTLIDRDELLDHDLCQSKLEEVRFHRRRDLQHSTADEADGHLGRPRLRPRVGRAPQHGAMSGVASSSTRDKHGGHQPSLVDRLRSWLATSTQIGTDDFQGSPAMYQVMQVVVNSEPQPRKPRRRRQRQRQKQRRQQLQRRQKKQKQKRTLLSNADDGDSTVQRDGAGDDSERSDASDSGADEDETGSEETDDEPDDEGGVNAHGSDAARGPPVVLCTLIYEGNGRLTVVPDFTDSGAAAPYRIKAGDGTLFHYTLHHVSEDISFEEQVQERAFAREWRQHTAHALRTQIGYVFEKPPTGMTRYHVGVEITATRSFGGGEFCVIAAANLRRSSPSARANRTETAKDNSHDREDECITFRTQRATTRKGVAHFGMCFDLEMTLDEPTASKATTLGDLYLQTNSFDWFGCRRVEGYACLPLPAVCGTQHHALPMWRPKGTLQQERTCFFLGGGIELEDDTFLGHPGSHTQGKTVVKPSVVGSPSGEILLRVHVLKISPT